MSTLSDLVAEIETVVDAIAGGTRSRMSQDYSNALTEFTALDTTRYLIHATHLNTINEYSQAPRTIVEVEVIVHHALSSLSGEQAYRDGQMASDQLAMISGAFWEDMTAVYAVVADFPAINQKPERTGKLISYSVGVQLALA